MAGGRKKDGRRPLAAWWGAASRVTPGGERTGEEPRHLSPERVRSPRAAAGLAVLAVVCAVFSLGTYRDAVTLRDHGARATATVLEVHCGRSSWVALRFTTATGREVTADVGNYSRNPRPRVGDRQVIIYDPSDPDGLVADVRTGPDFDLPWLLGAGALLAAALVWPTFTGRMDRLWEW